MFCKGYWILKRDVFDLRVSVSLSLDYFFFFFFSHLISSLLYLIKKKKLKNNNNSNNKNQTKKIKSNKTLSQKSPSLPLSSPPSSPSIANSKYFNYPLANIRVHAKPIFFKQKTKKKNKTYLTTYDPSIPPFPLSPNPYPYPYPYPYPNPNPYPRTKIPYPIKGCSPEPLSHKTCRRADLIHRSRMSPRALAQQRISLSSSTAIQFTAKAMSGVDSISSLFMIHFIEN